ncbi:MAG TPA: 6-carboxytetrahydropterin synthase QueD [Syntrophales bacterium]|nr:6-carboxytetrahydropterin synthase QueD [Syntrophales bacterium]
MYEVTIKQDFSAAHTLMEMGGSREKLHGHNFAVEVSVCSDTLDRTGILIDFRKLRAWTDEILKELDHKYLNDVSYFKSLSPSSENIARYIYDRMSEKAKRENLSVSRVTVWESGGACSTYYGKSDERRSETKR